MPYFWYKETDKGGKIQEGYLDAESRKDVITHIRARGNMPVEIKEKKPPKDALEGPTRYHKKSSTKGADSVLNKDIELFSPKVKLKDLAILTKQTSVMLSAGMDLIRTIDVLTAQAENKTMQNALYGVGIDVKKGFLLSNALKQNPKVFPELLVAMVESGELTGSLDLVMENMSVHYTKEESIQRKIKSAMVYPILLAIVIVVVVTVLIVYVLPLFVGMFDDAGMALPGPTVFLLGISESITNFWYLYGVGLMLIIFGSIMLFRVDKVRYVFYRGVRNIPVLGTSIVKIASARFCRTLATLLSSGIPIVKALEAAAKVTNNEYIIVSMKDVIEGIKKGQPLNILIRDMHYFLPMMISMVSIGEESGDIETMLQRTADYYDSEMEATINDITSLVQPIMIVIMALIVGFVVIALFLPMIESLGTIGQTTGL
ncbi:MAG: type II secretion system F family protein [Lachnospirales bacterium]